LVAFDDPALERAIHRVSERLGMHVKSHDVVLRGACLDCED
jgi:Fe2+ or Zn2+ uptake regulation protein